MSKQHLFLVIAIPTVLIVLPALVVWVASLLTRAAEQEVAESRRFRQVAK